MRRIIEVRIGVAQIIVGATCGDGPCSVAFRNYLERIGRIDARGEEAVALVVGVELVELGSGVGPVGGILSGPEPVIVLNRM